MNERLILTLSPRWRIVADDLQWIVQKYNSPKWRAISFVGSNKVVLRRVLAEERADIGPEGQAALDALPATFKEWKRLRSTYRDAAE